MVRSKGSVKNVKMSAYGDTMELRSMSKRPPAYSNTGNQTLVKFPENSAHGGQNENESSRIILGSRCPKFLKCSYCLYGIVGLFAFLLCVVFVSTFFPYPMHASCIVKWKFGDPCTSVMQKFRWQILNWPSYRLRINCGPHGSRCFQTLNTLTPVERNAIEATHIAPRMQTIEKMHIVFEEMNKTCVATGESVSNDWLRLFDYGANYCNLHNLITGIGFDKNPKFMELTTDSICTQYSMAACE